MPHRPDPVDLIPTKFTLFGTTNQGLVFRTGFWTRDVSPSTPPTLAQATAWTVALRPLIRSTIDFLGWGYRQKGATLATDTAFASGRPGTYAGGSDFVSESATLSYGGVAIDPTGVARNIRCISHVPRGMGVVSEGGTKSFDRSVAVVATYLDWFATMHPTDAFGRPLTIYPRMDIQFNAYYQGKRGA